MHRIVKQDLVTALSRCITVAHEGDWLEVESDQLSAEADERTPHHLE